MLQLILNFFPSLKDKEVLHPLDINSLSFYWGHRGHFNVEHYEKILKAKVKKV